MDDFYSTGEDDFYSGDVGDDNNPGGAFDQGNPFDSSPVDFNEEDTQRNDDFYAEGIDDPSGGNSMMVSGEEGTKLYIWNTAFWTRYFEVDTKDILMRIFTSLWPVSKKFLDDVKGNPDLWGPFWICTTLVFFMTWTGNLASYINSYIAGTGDTWNPDVQKLPWGAMSVFGYWLVIPLIFWGIFKYKEIPISLVLMYCIWGYSLFPYIPISIVTIAALGPLVILSWVFIMLACAWSTFFLCLTFIWLIRDADWKAGYFVVLFIGLCSIGLGLSFKFYFFQFDIKAAVIANTTTVITTLATTLATTTPGTTAPAALL